MSAVRCLVSSQSTHVTDRQTDGRTDGQNYDSQAGMLILGLGLGIECSGLGINNKANRHII